MTSVTVSILTPLSPEKNELTECFDEAPLQFEVRLKGDESKGEVRAV